MGAQVAVVAWKGPLSVWREAAGIVDGASANATTAGATLQEITALAGDIGSEPSSWVDGRLTQVATDFEVRARLAERVIEVFESNEAGDSVTLAGIRRRVAAVTSARDAERAAAADLAVCQVIGVDIRDANVRTELRESVRYLGALSAAGLPEPARRWLVADVPGRRKSELEGALRSLASRVQVASSKAGAFAACGSVSWGQWFAEHDSPDRAPLKLQVDRLEAALGQEPTLHTWARYSRFRAQSTDMGGGPICELVDAGSLEPGDAARAFEGAAFSTLAGAMLLGDPDLARLAGTDMEQVRERFAELDRKFIDLTAQLFSHQLCSVKGEPGTRGAYVRDYTDGALIEHVAPQTQPRVTIREVFKRASTWLMQMKPCFMMSPQAVAHYLPPGSFEFDVIVMDEASQIRPEDALGAIARARQVIVVGDPMQLGPTSFFARHVDADQDDDEDAEEAPEAKPPETTPVSRPRGVTVMEQSESILDAAAARFPMRVLKWHYRSRHPKLIAFSNKEFYGNDLIVFPTPEFAGSADGVYFRAVAGAVYDSHVNMKEAEAVVEAVRKHAAERPDDSLLIATLNLHQADLIERLLDRAELTDQVLADYRARHLDGPEPLDVKNLENVQGDERDVIFVSVTFGPKPDGSFSQAFGPINQVGGERRLNVLFTRAKHRLEVFCSFDPTQLRIDGKAPRGLRVMAEYLKYAQDGKWATGAPTGYEPDSDFEVAVARALAAKGLQVQPQVGVSGYRIDLGIHHPTKPGVYVLGVECDGATYHSAKSARDRDRLREAVLKGYGWNIHRIWSTDWFRDPARQVAAVVDKVKRLAQAT
jgi:very-short-patch-repair endonuclease